MTWRGRVVSKRHGSKGNKKSNQKKKKASLGTVGCGGVRASTINRVAAVARGWIASCADCDDGRAVTLTVTARLAVDEAFLWDQERVSVSERHSVSEGAKSGDEPPKPS